MIAYATSNAILDAFFARGSSNPAIPTASQCWIGMSTTVPTMSGGGTITNFTEPASSTGYRRSRLGIQGNASTYIMDAASAGVITNGTNFIFFDEATVGQGGFGELKWFGLFSAQTGGNPILAGELTSAVTVPAGNVLIFRPKNLKVSME